MTAGRLGGLAGALVGALRGEPGAARRVSESQTRVRRVGKQYCPQGHRLPPEHSGDSQQDALMFLGVCPACDAQAKAEEMAVRKAISFGPARRCEDTGRTKVEVRWEKQAVGHLCRWHRKGSLSFPFWWFEEAHPLARSVFRYERDGQRGFSLRSGKLAVIEQAKFHRLGTRPARTGAV